MVEKPVPDNPYSAGLKSPAELLADLESGEIAGTFKGNTIEYTQLALQVAIERSQKRWMILTAVSACGGALVALAALVIALAQ
jgi:hypothetical protein